MAEPRLGVRIQADTRALRQIEAEAQSMASHVNRALGGIANAAGAPIRAIGGITKALSAVGLATIGVQGLANAAVGLGSALGIGLNVELENVQAQLLAFTKDGAKADQILEDIRKRAAQTPFAFKEMASATAGLLPVSKAANANLMDLVATAEILAASNPAQGLEGAAFALREAAGGDFTSIIERFNLSRQTINRLKEEGVPNLEIITRAMKEMGFDADLVGNLAKTASGKWSTFLDTIDTIRVAVSKPLFEILSRTLSRVQEVFDANADAIMRWAETIGDQIGITITNIGRVVGNVIDVGRQFVRFLSPDNDFDLMRAWFGPRFGTHVDEIVRGIKRLAGDWIGFAKNVKGSISDLLATGNVGRFIENIGLSINHAIGTLGPNILAQLNTIGNLAGEIGAWLGEQVGRIDFAAIWSHLQTAGVNVAAFLLGALQRAGDLAMQLHGWLVQEISRIDLAAIWSTITTTAASVGAFVSRLLGQAGEIAREVIAWVTAEISKIDLAAIWSTITTTAASVGAFVGALLGQAGELVSSLYATIRDAVLAVDWTSVANTIRTALNDALALIDWHAVGQTIATKVSEATQAADWPSILRTAAVIPTLIEGLIRDANATDWTPIGQTIGRLVGQAIKAAFSLVGGGGEGDGPSIIQVAAAFAAWLLTLPSRIMTTLRKIGRDIAVGIVQGLIEELGPSINAAIDAVHRAIRQRFGMPEPGRPSSGGFEGQSVGPARAVSSLSPFAAGSTRREVYAMPSRATPGTVIVNIYNPSSAADAERGVRSGLRAAGLV